MEGGELKQRGGGMKTHDVAQVGTIVGRGSFFFFCSGKKKKSGGQQGGLQVRMMIMEQ